MDTVSSKTREAVRHPPPQFSHAHSPVSPKQWWNVVEVGFVQAKEEVKGPFTGAQTEREPKRISVGRAEKTELSSFIPTPQLLEAQTGQSWLLVLFRVPRSLLWNSLVRALIGISLC